MLPIIIIIITSSAASSCRHAIIVVVRNVVVMQSMLLLLFVLPLTIIILVSLLPPHQCWQAPSAPRQYCRCRSYQCTCVLSACAKHQSLAPTKQMGNPRWNKITSITAATVNTTNTTPCVLLSWLTSHKQRQCRHPCHCHCCIAVVDRAPLSTERDENFLHALNRTHSAKLLID